ncbi:porin [Limnohabitans sp.]|jgi:predicted porin|uniref:porin n=1 Tax=Limnohabitans sp. TaxID=1907725 RepID=UPI0037BFDEE8
MKKSLIALAVLAASGTSFAQSSVTVWGVVDAAVSRGTSDLNSVTRLVGSGISSSQLGFRGTEDLGGGMKANFWLEAGVSNDNGTGGGSTTNNTSTGTGATSSTSIGGTATAGTVATNGTQGLTFNRRSTVSLSGGFGEIRLGRDYTPQFWNWTVYDPFGTNGVGTNRAMLSSVALGGTTGSTTGTAVRASNSVTYLYNHGANATYAAGNQGLHAAVQMYYGENVSTSTTPNDGDGTGIRVGYNAGPLSAAVGYGQTKFATGNMTMTNFGASYNLGVANLIAQITKDQLGTVKGDGMLLGMTAPMGAGLVRASYSTYENKATLADSQQVAVGYVHNLSKRTRAYVTYANVKNGNGANAALGGATGVANKASSGFDIGMTHSF